jgi:hypothetical protein
METSVGITTANAPEGEVSIHDKKQKIFLLPAAPKPVLGHGQKV